MLMLVPRLPAVLLCAAVVGAAACGGDDDSADTSPSDETAGATAADLDGTITVFAAASLTDAFEEAAEAFEEANPDVTVELNLAGSSALREQILAGAPADVFASANPSNMDQVAEAGEVEGDAEVLVHNSLQIVVAADNPGGVEGLEDFADDSLLIGLCAVEVPCGDFGRDVLANAGVTPAPDTEEPDVRSLLTKVASGDLDAGLVYVTDVESAGDDVEGIDIPDDVNEVADYPIASLAGAGEPEIAAAFVDYLLSDDGQAILTSHGFAPA
jgi:molybdate transport system substrate-binding protein